MVNTQKLFITKIVTTEGDLKIINLEKPHPPKLFITKILTTEEDFRIKT